jgi:crotonobetainyl-CoA hydratase
MGYQHIRVEQAGAVTTVTLNRPEAMNAVHTAMHHELEAAFDGFATDAGQHVCVVTGAGERAFCAGSDLKASARGEAGAYPAHGYAGLTERFDLAKPVIAAVNGVCLGGGFEIALACDLIVAADTASFGLPEPRVGAIAVGGGVHRLARQIGLKRAMGHLLACDRISAQEGLALGFVNEVVPAAELSAAVGRWCEKILLSAPLAIRATKAAAMRGLDEPSLEAAIRRQVGYPEFKAWLKSEDLREGARAFAERRAPEWKGR